MTSIYRRRRGFFEDRHRQTLPAATRIAERTAHLLGEPPKRLLDVGCGVGTFLHAFAAAGATDLLGLEGEWLERKHIVIDPDRVHRHDLREPLPETGRFDLVISLEVAEHLPPNRAASFVAELCDRGPAVLFSAAIPLQGGVGHLNEQWPSWWAELFAAERFRPVDGVRPAIWSDEAVATWYRQNTVLYLHPDHPASENATFVDDLAALDLVHPKLYLDKTPGNDIGKAWKALARATRRSIRQALQG